MRKNILVLASSARKGGNSDLLSNEFIRGVREAGHEAEKIYVADKQIKGCIGCRVCRNTGACVQRDDMQDIYDKLLAADAYVLASPVYFYSFNAQMKAVMDRSFAIENSLKAKNAYLITSSAAPAEEYMSVITDSFRKYISCFNGITEGGIVYGMGSTGKGDIKNKPAMQQAYEMGRNV